MKIEEKMSKDEAELYIDELAEKLEIDLLDFNVREKSPEEKKVFSIFFARSNGRISFI